MNFKKFIKNLCYFIMFSLLIISMIGAEVPNFPDKIKITTEKNRLYQVQYNDFYIDANKIKVEGRNDIVYCLEIDKGYPSGQIFVPNGNPSQEVENIIAAGYPSKSPSELGVSNENEAYFATQIAIWSSVEDYDVNKMTGENQNILNAIKNIYNEGVEGKSIRSTEDKLYTSTNKSIQQVVLTFDVKGEKEEISETPSIENNTLAEEEAERQQDEYPPQEG